MTQIELIIYLTLSYLMSEHLFQTQHMMITKWENTLDGYWNCLQHSLIHVGITVFFIYIFTQQQLEQSVILLLGCLHFFIDKFKVSTLYISFIKKTWAPLTLKLFRDAEETGVPMDKINEYYNEKWQNELKLDESTFLGTIYYIHEFQMVNFLLNIVPIILYWKYIKGV